MAQLAIRGHETRGKEVIEILEMLGGNNLCGISATNEELFFVIRDCDGIIVSSFPTDRFVFFTLEEFFEKYPYKIEDEVLYHDSKARIKSIKWDGREVIYTIECNKEVWETTVFFLQPYKEETMEGVYAYNEINCYHQDFGDKVRIRLGNDFEIKVEDKITYIVKKKPEYPKNYKECCDVLGLNTMENDAQGYKGDLIICFQELIIARDAYWKIVGEQMGLGKPWEPDLENEELYCIQNYNKQIIKSKTNTAFNKILIFPTEEMRNAFYDNFENTIKECKELL